jgi:uncharacterized protein
MPAVVALPARPGLFLYESVAGATPPAIATFNRCYVFGSSTLGDALTNSPQVVGSMDEFTTLFGSSAAITLNSITAYLANLKRSLYFIKVRPNPIATVTVATIAAGNYTLTVGGNPITVTIPASPTPTAQIVIDAIVAAINNNTTINQLVQAEYKLNGSGQPTYSPAEFWLRSKDGNIFTLTAGGANISVSAVAAPGSIGYLDWLAAVDRVEAIEQESELGFMVAPEAFYTLSNQFERTVLGNRMEQACRTLGWMALLDPGAPTTIDHPIKAKTDAAGYTAIRGHSAYYYPYLQNTSLNDVAPSVMVAAFALQCYEQIGVQKPPAGSNFPFKGVTKLRYTLSQAQQDDLAQNRINTILYKNGVGFIPGDTLTRSTDTNFKMVSTRIIMSCIERTIYRTLDASGLLFESIGGRGIFYIKLRNVLEGVLARFYEGAALYGERPEDAYAIRCDESVQNAADLEAGIVNAEIYAVPAATARQIRGVVFRVAIGNIPQALLSGAV